MYAALRAGRCYLAVDSIAPARGFDFWAEGPDGELPMGSEAPAGPLTLRTRLPQPARLRLLRDGELVEAEDDATELARRIAEPGVYRVEARRRRHRRDRTWVISNPIYLR